MLNLMILNDTIHDTYTHVYFSFFPIKDDTCPTVHFMMGLAARIWSWEAYSHPHLEVFPFRWWKVGSSFVWWSGHGTFCLWWWQLSFHNHDKNDVLCFLFLKYVFFLLWNSVIEQVKQHLSCCFCLKYHVTAVQKFTTVHFHFPRQVVKGVKHFAEKTEQLHHGPNPMDLPQEVVPHRRCHCDNLSLIRKSDDLLKIRWKMRWFFFGGGRKRTLEMNFPEILLIQIYWFGVYQRHRENVVFV